MRNQKGNIEKRDSKKTWLGLFCRPLFAMRNRLEIAVEDSLSAITVVCSEDDLIARLRQLQFSDNHIRRLEPLLKSRPTHRLIQEWATAKNYASLYALLQSLDTVRGLGESVSGLCWDFEDEGWIVGFPEPLHDVLRELSRSTKEAPSIAEKLLSHDVPCMRKLFREQAFLQDVLDRGVGNQDRQSKLLKRVAGIDRLISEPPKLSQARIGNLRQKLRQRALLETERTLYLRVRIAVSRALEAHDIDVTKSEIDDSLLMLMVNQIYDLGAANQSHGWTVLRHAIRGELIRWDGHDANRDYVASMQRLGLEMDPWLDPERRQGVSVKSGEELVLQFTRSALDYLLMGHHFSTCLSPDDENFYSTIANALDVNKQVLYARTVDGRVIGRCLMTLGTEGELLIYQVYAHQWYPELCSAVKKFAEDLARDMNTRIATLAAVTPLVVEDWYDDEPIDIDEEVRATGNTKRIEAEPPPTPEIQPQGRLGAIDLSGASQDFLVTFAADYHRYV